MGILSDFSGCRRMERYGEHAISLNVSPRFLYHKYPGDCLPINKMIIDSTSCEKFRRKADIFLFSHGKTDFYDFSLIMGKFTGIYNIYSYEFLNEELKKEISGDSIDSRDVFLFLDRHFNSFAEYFQNQYHISSDDVQKDIYRMFKVSLDDTVYRSPVCRDVGKILISAHQMFSYVDSTEFNHNISYLISSGYLIEEFHKMNQVEKSSSATK